MRMHPIGRARTVKRGLCSWRLDGFQKGWILWLWGVLSLRASAPISANYMKEARLARFYNT